MKAVAVLPARREVGVINHPSPRFASPTEVMLRVLDVGVCGTDKEICTFEYGTPPRGSDYLVLGHEALAEVVEVGPKVTRVRVGDLVVPMVRRPCTIEECTPCRAGRQDFCTTGAYTERGIKQAHGFMTELAVDEERFLNVVPRELREIGVLVEPLTIAEKALDQVWQVQQRLPWAGGRRRAVVLGSGPVGLLGAMALVTAGFETTVYSREKAGGRKSAVAVAIGAKYVSAATDSIEALAARVGGIDLVYEASGASQVSFELLGYLGVNAVFVFTGVPGRKAPIALDADRIMRNLVLENQIVFGTVNAGRASYEAAVRDLGSFAARWPDAVRAIITGRFGIEEHRGPLLGTVGGIKNVIAIGG